MTSAFGGVFDGYVIRARIFPATLAVLPVTVVVLLVVPRNALALVGPAVISAGGIFFLAQLVRDLGRRLEGRLIANWDGWPTTAMLLPTNDSDRAVVERRRARLQQVTGITLPASESRPDTSADAIYHSATRALIAKTRDAPGAERVQDENISYGFRRNLLALKPVGITAAAAAAALAFVLLLPVKPLVGYLCIAADLAAAVLWITVVTPNFVRRQAYTYAVRLFETLDDERLTGPRD